ncbi:MAG: helix-turn-helix domain-containing protein [Candidatus Buchananbacteria bacterium]
MKDKIKQILAEYGLSDKEVKIYLALLGQGSLTVKELSIYTKIKRTSIYPIADKMVSRGILGIYSAKYGTHYIATSPLSLLSRIERIKTEFQESLPELEAMQKKETDDTNVKYYKGKEGHMSVLNETLKGYSHEIFYIGSAKDLNEVISDRYVLDIYIPARLKRKIILKQIVFPDKFSKTLKKTDNKELRFTRFLPANYAFTGNMIIFENKVAYFSSIKELTCVKIESKEIFEMEKEKFKLMWDKLI